MSFKRGLGRTRGKPNGAQTLNDSYLRFVRVCNSKVLLLFQVEMRGHQVQQVLGHQLGLQRDRRDRRCYYSWDGSTCLLELHLYVSSYVTHFHLTQYNCKHSGIYQHGALQ